jgi:hypothetical protein
MANHKAKTNYNTFMCDVLDDPSTTTKKYPAVLLNATMEGVSCFSQTIYLQFPQRKKVMGRRH